MVAAFIPENTSPAFADAGDRIRRRLREEEKRRQELIILTSSDSLVLE